MKTVILRSISIRNFRGAKEVITEFSPYETTISGRNGSGKSRHFDAFLWLLFGKDMEGRTDFEIKTKDAAGSTMDEVEVEVSAVMEINGATNELKRALVENWTKPKGQAEKVFKGNETKVSWNDVSLKVSEFETRVAGIIDSTLFRMLTNPLYFPNMKWQDQREMLFQMAGTLSDAEIAARKPEYAALMDKISGKSLTEYRIQIAATKKKLKEELETIQPRIDQTQKLMPEAKDWEALEAGHLREFGELEKIDAAISDRAKANRIHYERIRDLQKQNNEMEQSRIALVNEAKIKQQQEEFKAGEEARKIEGEIKSLSSTINYLENEHKTLTQRIDNTNNQLEQKRAEFQAENDKQFDGSDNCSHCGQILPQEKRSQARNLFAEGKKAKLDAMNAEGGSIKNTLADLKKNLEELSEDIASKTASRGILQAKLERLPKPEEAKGIDLDKIGGYSDFTAEIEARKAEIDKLNQQEADTEESKAISAKKAEVMARIDSIKTQLRDRDLISKYTIEIANLQAKSKDLGQQLADLERDEFTIGQFTKDKIQEAETRVNSMFEVVKFELYKYTIEGNPIETCTPTVNGVPFGAVNTAGQIRAGLDIIKSLQKFHGAYFPIFCDRAESVNEFPAMDNQMIYLKVTEGEFSVIEGNLQLEGYKHGNVRFA